MPILKAEADLLPADLFDRPPAALDWAVAYVKSRREKALARYLESRRLPFYLPLEERLRRRGGRTRRSYLPLFPGYVFLPQARRSRLPVLKSNLVVHTLEVVEQDLLHRQLESLWRLQASGARLVPHPYLEAGDEVEIVGGCLRGFSGRVLRAPRGLRLVVSITFLRRSVAATVERDLVAPRRRGSKLDCDPWTSRSRSPRTHASSSPGATAWSAPPS
ncbi:MAG: hypothetical protein D6696_02000 [Acidobacteria bacterium]|nr:MAG: hypothetical protein D6696_02000 [Acidobacteriota bacterium]